MNKATVVLSIAMLAASSVANAVDSKPTLNLAVAKKMADACEAEATEEG